MPSSTSDCGGANRRLTDHDRRVIADARALAQLRTTESLAERFPGWNDTAATYAEAYGTARHLLTELAGIAERLGGEGSHAR
jgi:hypothetical protein